MKKEKMSSNYSQRKTSVGIDPAYHCKHKAYIGDIVCPANIVNYSIANLEKQKLYLVIGLEEDYEGFEKYTDFLDGLEKSRDNFVWYAFLLAPCGKIKIEKLNFLRKVNTQ